MQIIPSIQLTFKAGETMTAPNAEKETYVSKIELSNSQVKNKDLQKQINIYKKRLEKNSTPMTDAELAAEMEIERTKSDSN